MTIILYLIFSHLVFISTRSFLKKSLQNIFKTKSEETILMIIFQYIASLIFAYIFIFIFVFIFINNDFFYFKPVYLFELLNGF